VCWNRVKQSSRQSCSKAQTFEHDGTPFKFKLGSLTKAKRALRSRRYVQHREPDPLEISPSCQASLIRVNTSRLAFKRAVAKHLAMTIRKKIELFCKMKAFIRKEASAVVKGAGTYSSNANRSVHIRSNARGLTPLRRR
jgi:hypothetical protein